ncbi:MAG: hypothetical protein ACOC1M_05920, partial [Halanaerobium sp.]
INILLKAASIIIIRTTIIMDMNDIFPEIFDLPDFLINSKNKYSQLIIPFSAAKVINFFC